MGKMSLDALNVINNSFANDLNATTNAVEAYNRDNEMKRRFLLDRIKFATSIGDKRERDEFTRQLNNGVGVWGSIKNALGVGNGDHALTTATSLNGVQDQGTPSADVPVPELQGHKSVSEADRMLASGTENMDDRQKAIMLAGLEAKKQGRSFGLEDIRALTNAGINAGKIKSDYDKANKNYNANYDKIASATTVDADTKANIQANKLASQKNSAEIADAIKNNPDEIGFSYFNGRTGKSKEEYDRLDPYKKQGYVKAGITLASQMMNADKANVRYSKEEQAMLKAMTPEDKAKKLAEMEAQKRAAGDAYGSNVANVADMQEYMDRAKGLNIKKQEANIAKENKTIDANNAKLVKAYEGLKQRQMVEQYGASGAHYKQHLDNLGITIPDKLTGDFQDQTGTLLNIYGTLADKAAKNGDWESYNKYKREYNVNMMNVFKSWGEDARQIPDIFNHAKGSGGGKEEWVTIKNSWRIPLYNPDGSPKTVDGKPLKPDKSNQEYKLIVDRRKAMLNRDQIKNPYSESTRNALKNMGFSEESLTNNSIEFPASNEDRITDVALKDEADYDNALKKLKSNPKSGSMDEDGTITITGMGSFYRPKFSTKQTIENKKAMPEDK